MKIHRGNFDSNKLFLEKTGLIKPGIKVLEIGSGTGAMVNYLKNIGADIRGSEVNDEYIIFSKKNYSIDLVKINNDKLPFEDSSFDLIISFDVFEHIPDTDRHLQEVKRLLKIDGKYIFSTPNKLTNIPFEIIKEKSLLKWKRYHCSLHTYNGIRKRLASNGFQYEFLDIPIVTEYFKNKIKRYLGRFGLAAIKIMNPDKLPKPLRTNFYLIAEKYELY